MKKTPLRKSDYAVSWTQLGYLLDFTLDTEKGVVRVRPRGPARCLWVDERRALVLYFEEVPRGTVPYDRQDARAARVYTKWAAGRDPAQVKVLRVRAPDSWTTWGRALSLGYKSDKFESKGTFRAYEHTFGKGVFVYRGDYNTDDTSKGVMVLRGGRLRVTARGIEG